MNTLVIDLTHGGVKIACAVAKKEKTVYCYDIYNTLKEELPDNIKLIELDDLKDLKGDLKVIYPVHLPLTFDEIKSYNPNLNYEFITHHHAVNDILNDWGRDILKVEVTGVKGKTSSVFMLKEILADKNPLLLSSLGIIENNTVLKRDISITPANIIECVELADNYDCAVFESSLGVTGTGDVGLLTNIVEDYPIAKKRKKAHEAKKQVFNCDIVCCMKNDFDKYYKDINHSKVNTFSLYDESANLYTEEVNCSLDETAIKISYNNIKTVNGSLADGKIDIKCFAPGPHLVSNVLGVICTAISLNIDEKSIIKGLENYSGIAGRISKRNIGDITVIEDINPGINTESIKQNINMIKTLPDYYISVGGDYGITCEEIDEASVSEFIKNSNIDVIFTGDVGSSINEKLNNKYKYLNDYRDVYKLAVENNKNLLFIYRSNYRNLSKR